MSAPFEGRCHCGAVTVTVPRESFGVVACHCDDCQKLHGNFFAMLAADRAATRWQGEEHVVWYETSPKARRSFCGRCGSRLAKDPHGSPKILVSVGLFGRETGKRIEKHVFSESKPDWYPA
jgi:hypothetical protein